MQFFTQLNCTAYLRVYGALYIQSVFLSVLNVPVTVIFSCDNKSMVGIVNLSHCIIGIANICAACCHIWVRIYLIRSGDSSSLCSGTA